MKRKSSELSSVRKWILFFAISLFVSGITAFPLESELSWICSWWPETDPLFYKFLATCRDAITETNTKYPYLAYGYDWLAFAHIVLAIAFIGPYRDPERNIWVIHFGMIACVLIVPLAFVAGGVRHIPVYWRLIDCSFGLFGFITLYIINEKIKTLHLFNSINRANKITSFVE